ncbi:hypothetical protein BJV78DRAFT_1127163 [Lactifluus subvellereus]|nr:hypothetical protein BJV78DRAFT_1127163 [Lactifluus subvellereus]
MNPDFPPSKAGNKRRRGTAKDALPAQVKRKKSAEAKEQISLRTGSTTDILTVNSRKAKESHEVSNKKSELEKPQEESDDEEADAGLEEAYERKVRPRKQAATGFLKSQEQQTDTSESEADASRLVHETKVKRDRHGKTSSRKAHDHVPPDETKEQRDARTIFLGNIPTEVAMSKSALKHLKRHILSHVPGAKIESTRIRSVAFQKPISTAPEPRAHNLERTAEWRAAKGDDASASQPRLSSHDKKKIAFINHELHAEADAVAVYVVFAYGVELAPEEAARDAAAALDNTLYMGRTLRADTIGGGVGDPKRTVFVGSLDFASREEDLRAFFEGVVSAERGPRSAVTGDADSDNEESTSDPNAQETKPKTWVTRVRIVRDKNTQLGKGFAYVQFADRECVDEILALEPGKLKFAKRKLRVDRCKTLPRSSKTPGPSNPRAAATPSTIAPSRSARPPTNPTPTAVLPKGNPDLGAQLAHLSKAERKAAKAVDAERVARRLAKKKARNTLRVPEQKKDRMRVRKNTAEHKNTGAAAPQKKSRVRSERSVARRNTKK